MKSEVRSKMGWFVFEKGSYSNFMRLSDENWEATGDLGQKGSHSIVKEESAFMRDIRGDGCGEDGSLLVLGLGG